MSKAATRSRKSAAAKATRKNAVKKSARRGASPAKKKAAAKTTGKTTKKSRGTTRKATTKTTPGPARKTRTAAERAAPVVGARPKDLQIDDEVLEFIAAVDNYKLQHGRPFPSWSEILWILKQLGYRKVG